MYKNIAVEYPQKLQVLIRQYFRTFLNWLIQELSLLLNSQLATVVTASGTYGVVNIELAAVRAYCQCGSYCLVMGSSLESTSL